MSYVYSGNFLKAIEVCSDIITSLEKEGKESDLFGFPINPYSVFQAFYGYALIFTGKFKEAKICIEKGLKLALDINNLMSIGCCEMMYAIYYSEKGIGKDSISHQLEAIKYFKEANFDKYLGMCYTNLGLAYLMNGELENARGYIEKSIIIHKEISGSWNSSLFPLIISSVYYFMGDYDEALYNTDEALELSKKNNESTHEALSLIYLGRLFGKKNHLTSSQCEENILHGINILTEKNVQPWLCQGYLFLGELYANTGRRDEALEYLNKSLSMFNEMGIQFWPGKVKEILNRL